VDALSLEEAQNDATVIALEDQHRAGVDIVTDGEMRRESYSNRFANALEGVDLDNPGAAVDRTGKTVPVPRVVGEIRRREPVEAPFIALPGPFTMAQQAQNDFYPDDGSLAMAYAAAVNEELRDLFVAGVDIVQLDEPYVQARPEAAREYAVASIDRALEGAGGPTVLHVCFGYGKHVADKPAGYAFLDELNDCRADEISIECAQPRLKMDLVQGLSPSSARSRDSRWIWSRACQTRRCTSACWICATRLPRRRKPWPNASGRHWSSCPRNGWWSLPTAA
jgi:5-methyltetrahydropteroyltriglutamate--homocysteine methyltransferase